MKVELSSFDLKMRENAERKREKGVFAFLLQHEKMSASLYFSSLPTTTFLLF